MESERLCWVSLVWFLRGVFVLVVDVVDVVLIGVVFGGVRVVVGCFVGGGV